jgi:hypothetical protein
MSDEKQDLPELTNKDKLNQINSSLENLKVTESACAELLKDKKIKIVNLADTSDDPLSLTLQGNAVTSVIRPILQGVESSRLQLVSIKEQILEVIEKEINGK